MKDFEVHDRGTAAELQASRELAREIRQSIEQWGESNPEEIETTYVERVVPTELEDECYELIDNWLKSKSFDPEEL